VWQAIDEELQALVSGRSDEFATELATALFVIMLRLHLNSPRHRAGIIRLLASSPSARAVPPM